MSDSEISPQSFHPPMLPGHSIKSSFSFFKRIVQLRTRIVHGAKINTTLSINSNQMIQEKEQRCHCDVIFPVPLSLSSRQSLKAYRPADSDVAYDQKNHSHKRASLEGQDGKRPV
jgi:hypothetical protein